SSRAESSCGPFFPAHGGGEAWEMTTRCPPERRAEAAVRRIAIRSSSTFDWKNDAVTRSAESGSGRQADRSVAVKLAFSRPRAASPLPDQILVASAYRCSQ